jgi:hypothetical protein
MPDDTPTLSPAEVRRRWTRLVEMLEATPPPPVDDDDGWRTVLSAVSHLDDMLRDYRRVLLARVLDEQTKKGEGM